MILVDSTKFVSWMRAGRNPVTVLESVLRSGDIVSCGVVRIEVLRGVVKPKPKAQMTGLFEAIPEVPLDHAVLTDAAEIAWRLDRKGRVLPVPDLLIASCVKRVGAVLITEDPHFSHIPGLSARRELA